MATCQACGTLDVTAGAACPACGAMVGAPTPPPAAPPPGDASWGGGPPPAAPPPGATPPPGAAQPPPSPPVPPVAPVRPSPTDSSHPSGLSSDARTYATFLHLSAFLGAMVAFAFIGPLIMWLLKREEHPFFDAHGKEATNFNLSILLYGFVGVILAVVTLGIGLVLLIPAGLVLAVIWIVATIQAAIAANRGQLFRYPLSIRFIS